MSQRADPLPSPFASADQRRSEREAKRDAVLLAAVRMFNERGFHRTSLDDVAASLGITKPTIYHYLGNKDRVLLECVTHGLEQLLAATETARASPGSGADRLRFCLLHYAAIIMDDFGRCVVRTAEEELGPDSRREFRALKRRIDAAVRGLIENGMADGSILPGDPKLLCFTLTGALNWCARWHDPAGPLSAQEVAADMVGQLARGFVASRPLTA